MKTVAVLLISSAIACNQQRMHESLALNAAKQLRERFNHGECEQIYNDASSALALKEKWLASCQQMRETLGVWNNVGSLSSMAQRTGTVPEIISVDGRAVFQNGDHIETYWFVSGWRIENSQARLTYIFFEGGGKQFGLPLLPKAFPKWNLDKGPNKPS
jgi:hypothetical protein